VLFWIEKQICVILIFELAEIATSTKIQDFGLYKVYTV